MSDPLLGWLSLDVSLLRRPSRPVRVDTVRVYGIELPCLDAGMLTRENLFDVRFDDVLAALAKLPRVDAEPDGFFVRTGEEAGGTWRLNGHLFELNERLWRVDLKGACPSTALDEVLAQLGWPGTRLVFQLLPSGVTVEEQDFRRWAARGWTHRVP